MAAADLVMELYPAIDLRAGRCVRLVQGDFDRETVYDDDPVAVAHAFAIAGTQWIHVVDLDAARTGEPANLAVIERIARAVDCNVQWPDESSAARSDVRSARPQYRRPSIHTTSSTSDSIGRPWMAATPAG